MNIVRILKRCAGNLPVTQFRNLTTAFCDSSFPSPKRSMTSDNVAVIGKRIPVSFHSSRSLVSAVSAEVQKPQTEQKTTITVLPTAINEQKKTVTSPKAIVYPAESNQEHFNLLMNGIKTGVLPRRAQIFRYNPIT